MSTIVLAKSSSPRMDEEIKQAMFRFRHKVFHQRLGWQVTIREGMEIDLFDELDPVYMVARNRRREVEGCWRLLPTSGPYMLKDTFPELLRGEPAPQEAGVWELSRMAVESPDSGDLAQAAMSPVTLAMIKGVLDFALQHGIRQYVTATSVAMERLFRRLGLPFSRFGDGKATRIGRVLSVACRMDIDEAVVRSVFPEISYRQTDGEVSP